MSDDTSAARDEQPSTNEAGTDAQLTPVADTAETTEADGLDELPEWARKRLTKANAEAATYRTRLREAEQKLSAAKSVEDFEQAVTEMKTANERLEVELLRERVARRFDLPDDLAARLQGSTAVELEADAKALAKYAVLTAPASLSGGLDPGDNDVFDPVAEARKARAARR